MGHCRFVLLGLLCAFLLSGCTTTYVPLPQTVEVPVTVVVTATPVAKATPTRAVEIPDNWLTYKSITGKFTFRYPPDWRVWNEREFSALFEVPGSPRGLGIELLSVPSDYTVGEKASVDSTVSMFISGADKDTQMKVLSKGAWHHFLPVNYVEIEGTAVMNVEGIPTDPMPFHMVYLQTVLYPGVAVCGFIREHLECITLADLEQLEMVMASLELE